MKPLLVVDPAKCNFFERAWLYTDGFRVPDRLLSGALDQEGWNVIMARDRQRQRTCLGWPEIEVKP